jgi:hypothetical protein
MAKKPTSVSLTPEQHQAIKEAQERLASGGETPSFARVIREAIACGLPIVVSQRRTG